MAKHYQPRTSRSILAITILFSGLVVAYSAKSVAQCDEMVSHKAKNVPLNYENTKRRYQKLSLLMNKKSQENTSLQESNEAPKEIATEANPLQKIKERTIQRQGNELLPTNILACSSITGLPKFASCRYNDYNIVISEQAFYKTAEDPDVYKEIQSKPLLEKLRLFKTLARTLKEIHELNLFHLNINPANILTDSEEVSDLFLSGIEFGETEGISINPVLNSFGNPFFYSPKLWDLRDKMKVLERYDEVWSLMLSISLIEIDSGKKLYREYTHCLYDGQLSECFKKISIRIQSYFKENQKNWKNQCGENAVFSFRRAFNEGLSLEVSSKNHSSAESMNGPSSEGKREEIASKVNNGQSPTEIVQRFDSEDLFNILNDAHSSCQSFVKNREKSLKQTEDSNRELKLERKSSKETTSGDILVEVTHIKV
jgi:hypothetical protein